MSQSFKMSVVKRLIRELEELNKNPLQNCSAGPINNKDNHKDYLYWNISGNSEVSYLELRESELTKTGPEYTVLQTFDL